MIRVFLDSTEFKSEPCRLSKEFGQLTELAVLKLLEIHTSQINVEEVTSWIEDSIKSHELKSIDAIMKASQFRLSSDFFKNITEQVNSHKKMFADAANDAVSEFKKWLKHVNAQIHEVEIHDGKAVMNAYFSGSPPFRKLKHRDDIPDAFIWQSLLRMQDSFKDYFFISRDKEFKSLVEKEFKGIKTYHSLSDFFEDEQVKNITKEWKAVAYKEALVELITPELERRLAELSSELRFQIEDHFIGKLFPDTSKKIRSEICEVRTIELPSLEIETIQFGTFPIVYLEFTAEIDLTVRKAMPKFSDFGNLYEEDDYQADRIFPSDSFSTDTHILGQEDLFIEISGEAAIELTELNETSGKEEVIDVIDDCEIRLIKVKVDHID